MEVSRPAKRLGKNSRTYDHAIPGNQLAVSFVRPETRQTGYYQGIDQAEQHGCQYREKKCCNQILFEHFKLLLRQTHGPNN
jgi:hypothetical protein